MNVTTVKQWLETKRVKRELDASLKKVNGELDVLEQMILDQLASDGVTGVKVNGTSVYVSTITKAEVSYLDGETTDQGYERTCDELVKLGLNRLVHRRFLHQSMTSWLASPEGDAELLKPFMNVTELRRLGVRNLKGEE